MTHSIFPPWDVSRWYAVDDRVRGGASISHLEAYTPRTHSKSGRCVRFWGTLDISTLGGAGFASQTYMFGPKPLSLPRHEYTGVTLSLLPSTNSSKADFNSDSSSPDSDSDESSSSSSSPSSFTLILKNTIRSKPPQSPNPKVPPSPEAVITYEAQFTKPGASVTSSKSDLAEKEKEKEVSIVIPWKDFIPHYRGREIKRDDPRYAPLRTEEIYELAIMCRSGFGKQQGEFEVVLCDIAGVPGSSGTTSGSVLGKKGWGEWIGGLCGLGPREGKIRLDPESERRGEKGKL